MCMRMLELILTDFAEPVLYIPCGMLVSGILTILYEIARKRIYNAKHSGKRMLWRYVIILYGYIILQVTFLSREPGSRTGVDWMLGDTWGNSLQAKAYVMENVLMMVPFGVLMPIAYKGVRSLKGCLLLAFAVSGAIELVQLLAQRGYCQIDDVIANMAGAFIGWLIWKQFRFWGKKAAYRRKHFQGKSGDIR